MDEAVTARGQRLRREPALRPGVRRPFRWSRDRKRDAALRTGLVPAFTRSEAEEKLLEIVRSAGLPRPELNVRIFGYEVDFLW